jgi:aryl-alcohol dehydrogenase-like predicted oxidoreductase
MRSRRFGTTELIVSELGLGCTRLGGVFQHAGKAETLSVLRGAFQHGVTFFDTADMYSQGESEALLGEAFRKDRHKVVIASKGGYCLPAQKRFVSRLKPALRPLVRRFGLKREHIPSGLRGTVSQNFSPGYIVQAVDQSLRRLGTDYIDVYQLHIPPTAVIESGELLEPLERLKRQGKIRYYGVSCESPEDALICLRFPELSAIQVGMSLLEQRANEEAIPRAATRGVALIARQPFASGLLAKPAEVRVPRGSAPDLAISRAQRDQIARYDNLTNRFGRPLPEVALQFVLGTPGVSVTLVGMRTMAHLSSNLRHLAATPLSSEEVRALLGNNPPALWRS